MSELITYTREDLLAICERAFVPHRSWSNRDSSDALRQVGECYALLRAGCDFAIIRGSRGLRGLKTDDRTIWVEISFRGFSHFEYGGGESSEAFYLPTAARLDACNGRDWY